MSETLNENRIEKSSKSEYSKLQKLLAAGALSLAAIGVGKVYEANMHNNDAQEHAATAAAIQGEHADRNLDGGAMFDDMSGALLSVSKDNTPDVARLSNIQGWASESSRTSADALGNVHIAHEAASERDDAAGDAALVGGVASAVAGASVAVGRRRKDQ